MKRKPPAMAYDSGTGEIVKMTWWNRLFDKEYRIARKRYRTHVQNGDDNLVAVAKTDGGVDVMMPPDVAAEWLQMPEEVRAEFLAAINEQSNEQKVREA